MTLIRLYRDRRGSLTGFSVIGHAGQAPEGEDIVCAAISALSLTAANALTSVAGFQPLLHVGDGFLSVRLPRRLTPTMRRTADIILKTAERGFSDIAAAYAEYVRISNQEVQQCFR